MGKWCAVCYRNELTGTWQSCDKTCPVFGKNFDELAKMVISKEYVVVYRTKDGAYQTIDKIYSEDSAYMVLTMVIKAGYKDARIEYVE